MSSLKEVIPDFSILRSGNDWCRQTGRVGALSGQELAAWRVLHSQWLVPWWGRCSPPTLPVTENPTHVSVTLTLLEVRP